MNFRHNSAHNTHQGIISNFVYCDTVQKCALGESGGALCKWEMRYCRFILINIYHWIGNIFTGFEIQKAIEEETWMVNKHKKMLLMTLVTREM